MRAKYETYCNSVWGLILLLILGCGEKGISSTPRPSTQQDDPPASGPQAETERGNGTDTSAIPSAPSAPPVADGTALAVPPGSDSDSSVDTASRLPVPSRSAHFKDVCGFDKPVPAGHREPDGMVLVPPNHPHINYFGRIDCTDPMAPSFAFPGVSIRAKFSGHALDLVFHDHGNLSNINYYNIIIDDGPPEVLIMEPGIHTYKLARRLKGRTHTIEVFKRNESGDGQGQGEFLGFRIKHREKLLPLPPEKGRIEFIGDSITCGYGDMLSTFHPDEHHYSTKLSNAYSAYGAVTARALNAELMMVAYSGRGAYRNIGGLGGSTIPQMYLRILPDSDQGATWDVKRFTPQVVVINLGTNDFSPGVAPDDIDNLRRGFEEAMTAFVKRLRGYYPNAAIILAEGPMMRDRFPKGYKSVTSVRTAFQNIIAKQQQAGDTNVYMFVIPNQHGPWGQDWHPTAATHQKISDLLVAFIRKNELM